MSDEILKIDAIKTDNGYYLKHCNDSGSWVSNSSLSVYFFDGKLGEKTHNVVWLFVKKLPKSIAREKAQAHINHRFELIDPSFANEKVPLSILREKAGEYEEDDYGKYVFIWNETYAHLKSLYKEISDPQPNIMVDCPFEIRVILEIDFIKEYAGFSYPVQRTRWEHEGFTQLTEKDAHHNLIDTIIFPGIILSGRESKLTSEQSYKIIRKHVQDNINPKWAEITSDYDFCFTVCKKIPLCKPVSYQKNVARFGARKPKYTTAYQTNRSVKIFEMGHSGRGAPYQGYEAIKGFEGANIEELKQNIDDFLKDLMEKINEPLKDCPHCNGVGVILNKE